MNEERYKRFIEKIESFKLDGGAIEPFDMHAGHWYAFMEGTDEISGRVDAVYRAYKFGMLQGLRFAKRYGQEQAADILKRVDQIGSTAAEATCTRSGGSCCRNQ